METIIKSLINTIKNNIISDLNIGKGIEYERMLSALLRAYNRYQEDERDGVDYIFNINNKEDLIACINGGLAASEIAWVYEHANKAWYSTPLFYFGVNHKLPDMLYTWDDVKTTLIAHLDEILPCMLAYHTTDGYLELYDLCVSEYMINNQLVP